MELHQLTRRDLYALATAARINRRSTMTKAQLTAAIEALAEHDRDMYGALELHYSLNFAPKDEAAEVAAPADTHPLIPDTEGVEYWRGRSRECHARRIESEERSDTDGFMSQWAAGQMANRYYHLATLAGRGWTWDYHALFDLDGNLVAAKYLKTRYGYAWAILESDDPDSRITGWFNESSAQDPARARATNARKGFYVGLVRVAVPEPSRNTIPSEHAGSRADGGFSRDVVILDNGK
jgi:hypothetical protein